MKNLQDLQLGPLLAVDEAPTEEPPSWMALQPEPLLAVDEAPAEERPRLLVGERPGPRHPLPRARPWTLAAVLPEQNRPVQKNDPEMSLSDECCAVLSFLSGLESRQVTPESHEVTNCISL